MAQLSGIDWNSEKLQKYVSAIVSSSPWRSSGTSSIWLDELLQLDENGPVEILGLAPLLERQVAAGEQVQRHVERLLGVVIALEGVADGQVLVGLQQVDDRLLGLVRRNRLRDLLLPEGGNAEHVEDEHAVIRDDRPTALRHDRRMLHAGVVAHCLDVVDDVVGVFLERVIDARFEVGLRPVVVDPEAAADVEVLQAGPRLHQLRIDAGRFVERALDDPDVRNLAAEVEVEQLEAILHAEQLQLVETAQDLGDGQAELRAIAAGALPAAAAARRELDAHADLRPHADLFGVLQDQPELGVFLDDRDDVSARSSGRASPSR